MHERVVVLLERQGVWQTSILRHSVDTPRQDQHCHHNFVSRVPLAPVQTPWQPVHQRMPFSLFDGVGRAVVNDRSIPCSRGVCDDDYKLPSDCTTLSSMDEQLFKFVLCYTCVMQHFVSLYQNIPTRRYVYVRVFILLNTLSKCQ